HHQPGKESLEAHTSGSRNRKDVVAVRAKELLYLWPTLLGDGEIHLGGNDDLWALRQGSTETGEFVIEGDKIRPGGTSLCLRAQVEQMHQETRAFDVFETVQSLPFPPLRPPNPPRH